MVPFLASGICIACIFMNRCGQRPGRLGLVRIVGGHSQRKSQKLGILQCLSAIGTPGKLFIGSLPVSAWRRECLQASRNLRY